MFIYGERQQRIVSALRRGPHSVEALVRQVGEGRSLILTAMERLHDRGDIIVTGRSASGGDFSGIMVSLPERRQPEEPATAPQMASTTPKGHAPWRNP